MGFKDEFKREMHNVMKDVEKEVNRTWEIDYKGHRIEVINQIKEELLIIDGITVDRNKRKYLLSHIMPYSKLSGILELQDGTKHMVSVKIGGYKQVNCIVKIDKETVLEDSLKVELIPWDHKEKIVPFIERQIEIHNKIVDDRLPDEEYLYDEKQPRMAAGLSDSFTDDIPTPFYVKKLLKLFEEQINDPTTKIRKDTYEKIIFDNIASYRDEFIELFQQAQLDESLAQQEAIWLLEHAAHREVVKFAIIVLGCTNCEKYKELLFTLGMHEEFTAYVIFALKNGTTQANNEIWRLAQVLHGWGKISAVEQLEAPTPEIKHWLLTEGCRSTIMNEYLAYTCAINGELDVALYEETISKELYDGAGLIIEALLTVQPFVNDSKWKQLAMDALQQDSNIKALEIAQFYQLNITQNLFDLLEKYPINIALYSAVMDTNNRQHIQELCTFAETHLSLTSLSDDEQDCLQCIVQDLYEHEGVGVPLIEAALKSDNGGLQYHALSVLSEWSPSFSQKPVIHGIIKGIAGRTKDKEDRQLAKQLLKKY
uniref:Uncharacterized protein n=1 Tax=Batrachochytrium dendrobatidis (strain JAM81 / FGSC 10211) TaxID=684364 RepID=F4PEW9_BATDJ|eukprot:XP_006683152.1 hypothetical protein BATDEDRAFT_28714 [Batrachochytrium dendrobatidis JAM81]